MDLPLPLGPRRAARGERGLASRSRSARRVLDPDRFDPGNGPLRAFLVGHARNSEGCFYGISAQISFGRVLEREGLGQGVETSKAKWMIIETLGRD